jgi:uncharacterized alpha-E superfamily protein
MLSRVADALFWMSRYLERAEQVARLLDVCFYMELDLRGVLAGPHEFQWSALAAILQQIVPPQDGPARFSRQTRGAYATPLQGVLSHWLAFDLGNPSSILSCVTRARSNARSIRGTINSLVWRELNKLYLQLSDADFCRRAEESPHEFYQAVQCGSHLFQGVCDATLTHDEGWQFIRLGRFLERADKTLRILDIQYHLLRELSDPADLSLSNLQWAAVLRSCNAYEAYQRLYVGRVEPERVVEFLLLNATCPRSVRFCLEEVSRALTAIEGTASGEEVSKVGRVLGRVLSDLRFAELEQILRDNLHVFLGGVLERCGQVGQAVQEQYSLR